MEAGKAALLAAVNMLAMEPLFGWLFQGAFGAPGDYAETGYFRKRDVPGSGSMPAGRFCLTRQERKVSAA